jgi:hypothetical protein
MEVQMTTQIAHVMLSKESNTGGIRISDFILYCRAIAIKATGYWHKNRHENQ